MDNSDRITPELVLVDPSLRARLQAQALLEIEREELDARPSPVAQVAGPETPVALRVPLPESQAIAPSPHVLGRRQPDFHEADQHEPGRHELGRHASLVASALVFALLVVPLLAFLPPRQAPRLVGPSAEAGVVAPRALRWAADPRANYYLLRIFLHDRLVHRTIVRAPTAVVPPLPDGVYDWDVYAGYGRTGQLIRRGPIADATFTVASPEATAAVPLPDEGDEPRRTP